VRAVLERFRDRQANGVRRRGGAVLSQLADFVRAETAGGAVLLVATIVAIVLANSPARGAYEALWSAAVDVRLGPLAVRDNVRHLINDGLMALFFFVVGLEIKRELRCGELAGRHSAALPGLAAAGGAMLPALLFTAILAGAPGAEGCSIPMATDIGSRSACSRSSAIASTRASGSFSWPSPWSTTSSQSL
jgi:NhaA family Na+:H+ antiporter